MPIVSRTLESVQPSGGGTVLVSFLTVDGKSRGWRRSRDARVRLSSMRT